MRKFLVTIGQMQRQHAFLGEMLNQKHDFVAPKCENGCNHLHKSPITNDMLQPHPARHSSRNQSSSLPDLILRPGIHRWLG
jgi:hypothetical protein